MKKTVRTDTGDEYGFGVERRDLPCPNGTVSIWGNTGGGPGFTSMSLITDDADKQLVLAMNIYDIAAELNGDSPVPVANPTPRPDQHLLLAVTRTVRAADRVAVIAAGVAT